jgi:hypothetical protein
LAIEERGHLRDSDCGMLTARQTLFVLALLFATAGDSWCQSQPPSSSPGVASQQPQTQSTQTNQPAESNQRGTESAPFVIKILPPVQTEQNAPAKHQEELSKAATDQKIADFTELLFYATAALAAIAVLQLFAFVAQCIQLKRTVEHMRISERAYVYGGFGGRNSQNPNIIHPNWANYGKTPTIVTGISIGIGRINQLPQRPVYPNRIDPGYVLGPQQTVISHINVTSDGTDTQAFYGRVWFRDQFSDKERSSGFILRASDMQGVEGYPLYWQPDYE